MTQKIGTNERNDSKSERVEGDPQRLLDGRLQFFLYNDLMSESVYSTKLPLLRKTEG